MTTIEMIALLREAAEYASKREAEGLYIRLFLGPEGFVVDIRRTNPRMHIKRRVAYEDALLSRVPRLRTAIDAALATMDRRIANTAEPTSEEANRRAGVAKYVAGQRPGIARQQGA